MENDEIRKKALRELAERELARRNYVDFIKKIYPSYEMIWFHERVANNLDDLIKGEIQKLMIFIPPQHGKSELSSRLFPAYALGRNPNLKVALASYSPKLAAGFNRKAQQYIDSDNYRNIFPNTRLNSKNVSTDSRMGALRNSEIFEIIGHQGFFKTVGVGQALTGTPVDLGIIDDPFKDRKDANSQTIRDNVWDWYTDVFRSRLHNGSKQLLLFTRWHEDDLAGRLLKDEPEEWRIINLPALKEDDSDPDDPREIGEALWEAKHSRKRLEKIRDSSPRTFAALYQQRPAPMEGDLIKREWFEILDHYDFSNDLIEVWIDGAWTKNTMNDPTGIMITAYNSKTDLLTVIHSESVHMELFELIDNLKELMNALNLPMNTLINIEDKASGAGIRQLLKKYKYNTAKINSKDVAKGKEVRVEQCGPFWHGGKVRLLKRAWTERLILQMISFPNAKHDDEVDLIAYATLSKFMKKREFFVS